MTVSIRPLAKASNPANSPAEQGRSVGVLFRDARRACGYSTETLAARLGVDERTVRRWQSGEVRIDLTLLCERAPDVGRIVAEAILGRVAA